MDCVSIFNDVLGPVMRGPSSSHNAGAHRIATLARSLLGEEPVSVEVRFDPDGSYAPTYEVCGVDLAFLCGFLGMPLTDERFFDAPQIAADRGLRVSFGGHTLPGADHPNYCEIALVGDGGEELRVAAKSVGGGAVSVCRIDDWPMEITGKWHTVLVGCAATVEDEVVRLLTQDGHAGEEPRVKRAAGGSLVCVQRREALAAGAHSVLNRSPRFPIIASAQRMPGAAPHGVSRRTRKAAVTTRTAYGCPCGLS